MLNRRNNLAKTAVCILVVLSISLGVTMPATAIDYNAEIQAWLEYVDEHGNFAGVETSGPQFEAIEAAGPNVLPDLMRVLQETTSTHHKFALDQAIARIAGISVYEYWNQASPRYENPATVRGATSTLLVSMAPERQGTEVSLNRSSVVMTEWWETRDATHTAAMVSGQLRALRKRKLNDTAFSQKPLLRRCIGREGSEILTVGIYGLPELIRQIAATNSPEAFCLFLNSSRNVEDYNTYYESEGEQWPTLAEKADYIRAWWTRERPRYTRLADLVADIDKAVAALPGE